MQVGSRTTELTLVDCPTVDDRCESNLKSSGRLKQERKTNFIRFFYTVNPLRQGRRDRWFEPSLPYQFFCIVVIIFRGAAKPLFCLFAFYTICSRIFPSVFFSFGTRPRYRCFYTYICL